jgi:DNA primase
MSIIEDIKLKVDVTEIIGESVSLQKAGRNFRALCPFHAEKHGSFFVFPDRQSWHCFGSCGTGGDVFSFVMKKDNIDFGTALRQLAERAGVTLVREEGERKEDKEREKLFQINEAAAAYYHDVLVNSAAAQGARSYLTGRGFSSQTIANFQLGYSPGSGDKLLKYLTDKGFAESDQVMAGVVVEGESGGKHDRFRHRLMFPIRDGSGRVIGFGGRALGDAQPKYLNSPQTALFDKSSTLYGLDRARASIRKQNLVVVVEGYPDVLMAHQHGFANVVASMGTSLTEKQVGALKKLTTNLVFALDADAAGEAATLRGVEVAARAFDQKAVPIPNARGVVVLENVLDGEIRVAVLPQGKDPDEIILEEPSRWGTLVDGAMPMVEYIFEMVAGKYDLSRAGDKSLVVKELGRVVDGIKDPVRRAHYLQKLARLVNVDERLIQAGIRGQAGHDRKEPRKSERGEASSPLFFRSLLEEHCLALLLRYPDLRGYCKDVPPDYFEQSENRECLGWLQSGGASVEELDTPLREHLEKLNTRLIPNEREGALKDCISRLKERFLRNAKVRENLSIEEAISAGDVDQLIRLGEQDVESSACLQKVFIERSHGVRAKTKGNPA